MDKPKQGQLEPQEAHKKLEFANTDLDDGDVLLYQHVDLVRDSDQDYDADVDDDDQDLDIVEPEEPEVPLAPRAPVLLEDPENDPVDDEISDYDEELYLQTFGHANLADLDDIDLDRDPDLDLDLDDDDDSTDDDISSSDPDPVPNPRPRANSI